MENKKTSFFQKVKISIFNLEKYGTFITEKLSDSIKYLTILVLIFTLFETVLTTYDNSKMFNKALDYLENQMSDFEIEHGELTNEISVDGYDKEYDFKIASKFSESLSDDELKEFDKFTNYIVLLKDKVTFCLNGNYDEIDYSLIQERMSVDKINKQAVLDLYNNLGGMKSITLAVAISAFIIFFVVNLIETALIVILVAIFGYFVARISKIKIRYNTTITLSIYSLTLSIILNIVYVVQLYFTGFEIQYFDILYIAIAYIYIVAAILIIKSDLIKQMIEVGLIEQIQKKIMQEQLHPKEENKDEEKKDEKKPDKDKKEKEEEGNIEKEPDGSEISFFSISPSL